MIIVSFIHSLKIFLRLQLAKIPRIIHHNQLLSTKFGRILRNVKNDVNTTIAQWRTFLQLPK